MSRLLLFSIAVACSLCVRQTSAAEAPMKPADLEQAIYAYADRYTTYIVGATDAMAQGNPSAEQRRVAHLIKLGAVSSIYDIATDAEAFGKLMDLVLVVTLQSYTWIDEDRAERLFGERAEPLIRALRQMRVDVWKLASRVLRPDQLQQVDALILDWRRQNPDLQIVSYVRFDDTTMEGSREALEEIKQAAGLFGLSEATKAVDQARLLGERAFFQAKRMPYLINWQVQAVLNEALVKPELAQSLQAADSLARSADRITAVAEKLPGQIGAEREAIVAVLEDRGGKVSGLLGEMRQTAAAADKLALNTLKIAESGERLALNVRETARTVESVQARQTTRDAAAPPSRPFDIEPYVRVSAELNQTVAGINSALSTLESADRALGGQIDRLFTWVLILMAAFFAMLLGYRLLAARLAQPK
jgi:hypothetical protein